LYYLARHDFAVDAADVDAGVEAGFVVGVDHVAPKCLIGTGSAVVWSLEKKMHPTVETLARHALPSFCIELVVKSSRMPSFVYL
jgi:hypothetical protein